MINLEQVKLLESKVAKAIDYIERLTVENASLQQREKETQTKLESCQKRIDELDKIVMQFREDHGQIETGILAALDRLSQFEKAMEKSLNEGKAKTAVKETAHKQQAEKTPKTPAKETLPAETGGDTEKICFEIPETPLSLMESGDINDPLTDTLGETAEGEELDIF